MSKLMSKLDTIGIRLYFMSTDKCELLSLNI
jgi:hypothetical protein